MFARACTAEFPCERLNQAMFAVEAEQAQAVEKLLRRLGFRLPQSAGDRGGEPVNSGNSNGVKLPAIVRSLYPDMIYTLETRTPEIEQAYPELKQIPKMWLEKPRSYHHSTCRELLQTAIEWGAYVKFKTETKEALIAPERVRETSGWSVEGRIGNQPITLPLEEWEQFQLILPGINDK